MAMILYSASGDPPPAERWRYLFPRGTKFIDSGTVPSRLPPWLTEQDLDFFATEFRNTGFRGGINWYRNIDRNWEMNGSLHGMVIRQPSMFAAGEHDAVLAMYPEAVKAIESTMPGLRSKTVLPGAGALDSAGTPAGNQRVDGQVCEEPVARALGIQPPPAFEKLRRLPAVPAKSRVQETFVRRKDHEKGKRHDRFRTKAALDARRC